MAEVLSQQQIDALLGSLSSGDVHIDEIEEQVSQKKIKDYDFRSPKKITRDQIKLLNSMFENFTRLFGLNLSSLLRVNCEAKIIEIEEQQFAEFSNALPDSVMIGILDLDNQDDMDEKQLLMEMSKQISFSIIDRLLGGNGEGYFYDREFTEIEISLLEYLFKQISPIFKNAWTNYIDIGTAFETIETNSRLIQSISQDETVIIIVIELQIKKLVGNINICLPSNVLTSVFKAFDSKYAKVVKKNDINVENQRKDFIMETLKESSLTVSASLGKTDISLEDLLSLQCGDIITLDTLANKASVSLNIENMPWFNGKLGVKKKKYAIKIDGRTN